MQKLTLSLLCILISVLAIGQTKLSLPYSTGFDGAAQKNGWYATDSGAILTPPWNYSESFTTGYTPASAPNCLQHPPATGGDPNILIKDWFMSPNIDFTNGAKLSFKINVFTMAGFFPGDTIRLYLFKKTGTAITRTLLADFAYMNSSNMNFRDTNNIIIPPTTGTETYLGFYYTTYNNWFNVAIDNINITPNIPAGIDDVNNPAAFTVFPNPAGNSINWDLEGKPTAKNTNVLLTDVTGKLLTTVPFATKTMDIGTLAPGIYYLKLGNRTARFIKQ